MNLNTNTATVWKVREKHRHVTRLLQIGNFTSVQLAHIVLRTRGTVQGTASQQTEAAT